MWKGRALRGDPRSARALPYIFSDLRGGGVIVIVGAIFDYRILRPRTCRHNLRSGGVIPSLGHPAIVSRSRGVGGSIYVRECT